MPRLELHAIDDLWPPDIIALSRRILRGRGKTIGPGFDCVLYVTVRT